MTALEGPQARLKTPEDPYVPHLHAKDFEASADVPVDTVEKVDAVEP